MLNMAMKYLVCHMPHAGLIEAVVGLRANMKILRMVDADNLQDCLLLDSQLH